MNPAPYVSLMRALNVHKCATFVDKCATQKVLMINAQARQEFKHFPWSETVSLPK